jgi:hypothetical protein
MMDKNKFWLGGRRFNTASPRLGAPTQRKARPEDGRPNATQGTSASWATQRKARHVRKLVTPTHFRNKNARHVRKLVTPTHFRNTNARHVRTSRSWAPQRNAWYVRKIGRPNTRPQRKCKARPHVRKLGAPTQCKARPQDGRPNKKLIRNENVHTREH